MNFNFGIVAALGVIGLGLVGVRMMRMMLDQRSNIYKSILDLSAEGFFRLNPNKDQWESLRNNNLPFLGYGENLPVEISEQIKKEALRTVLKEGQALFLNRKMELMGADKTLRNVQVKIRRMEDSDGNYMVSVTNIITAPKAVEISDEERMQKVQIEKYAVLRDLGAGVSHEINNPLAIILGKAQTLKIRLSRGEVSPESVLETIDKIEFNVKRISKIVLALRMMTKDSTHEESENIAVVSLFEDLASVWAERLKNKGYDFKIPTLPASMEVYGKRSLLITALFNIVSNSFEATQDLSDRWIRIECGNDTKGLSIAITDSGTGIPDLARQRIFDPFFTTRDAAKSSGLGLSVAKGIFELHKGSIEYDTALPNTKFIVHIPLAVAAPADVPKAA